MIILSACFADAMQRQQLARASLPEAQRCFRRMPGYDDNKASRDVRSASACVPLLPRSSTPRSPPGRRPARGGLTRPRGLANEADGDVPRVGSTHRHGRPRRHAPPPPRPAVAPPLKPYISPRPHRRTPTLSIFRPRAHLDPSSLLLIMFSNFQGREAAVSFSPRQV